MAGAELAMHPLCRKWLGNQNLEDPQSYKIAVGKSAQPLFQREVSFLSWSWKKKKKSCLQPRRKTTSSKTIFCVCIIEMDVCNQKCQDLFTKMCRNTEIHARFYPKMIFHSLLPFLRKAATFCQEIKHLGMLGKHCTINITHSWPWCGATAFPYPVSSLDHG